MTGIILPPNLPPEVEREIVLAVLAAGPDGRDHAIREVVRRSHKVVCAWGSAVPQAMRCLCRLGLQSSLQIADNESIGRAVENVFGCVHSDVFLALREASRIHQRRSLGRVERSTNFDTSISHREARQVHRRLRFASAAEAFSRAKKGYW